MLKKIFPAVLLSFVNVIGFSLLIPVLPELIKEFTGSQNGLLYGAMLSFYALSQFVATPIMGSLSDVYGRRPLLLVSQFGTLLSWVIFASAYFVSGEVWGLSLPLVVVAISRMTDGFTGGNNSVANAWVSDVVDEKDRTKAFGLMGAAFGFGFLFGPALGGLSYSTEYGLLGTAAVAIVISLIALIGIWWKLPETVEKHECKKLSSCKVDILKEFSFVRKIKDLSKERGVLGLIFARGLFSFAFVGFTTGVILLLESDLGLSPVEVGLVMSVIGVFSMINQAVLVRKLADWLGELKCFYLGLILVGGNLILLSILTFVFGEAWSLSYGIAFFVNAFLMNLGLALVMVTFRSILVKKAGAGKRGLATGLEDSISAFGRGVVPTMAGVVFDFVSFWAFVVYGAVLFIPVVLQGRRGEY